MKELILALDVTDRNLAIKIANDVSEYISRIKVNYPLVLSTGIDVLKDLSKIRPVIADFKIADIPYTSSKIAEIAFANGAESVITHGFVGSDTVKAVLEVARRFDGKVYVVTELSSEGGAEFMAKVSDEIVKIAEILGCDGLIAPATRIDRLKEIRSITNLEILCPGIGVQGGDIEAVKYCDGIIVGRSIYGSEDPKRAAKEFRSVLDEI